MNPLLEVNPAACLFVMGPQLLSGHRQGSRNSTRSNNVGRMEKSRLSPSSPPPPPSPPPAQPATYSSVFEAGTKAASHLLQEDVELIEQMKNAAAVGEGGVTEAMERLVALVKRNNCYEEWLKMTFGQLGEEKHASYGSLNGDSSTSSKESEDVLNSKSAENSSLRRLDSFHYLLTLQKQGALLACTQYDTLLDSVAGTVPVTLQDTETLKQWSRLPTLPEVPAKQDVQANRQHSSCPVGILHLHGVCTNPSSIHLTDYGIDSDEEHQSGNLQPVTAAVATTDKEASSIISSSVSGMDILREVFRRRLVIFVGFDREYFDPLLPGLVRKLYPDNQPGSLKNPPILLTSTPLARHPSVERQLSSHFLILTISEEEVLNLSTAISSGSPKNFTVGKGLTDKQSSDGLKVQAFLLFNEKQSFRKLGDVIYQQSKSGEIYVRRDALTVIFDDNKILYGNLVTYGGNGLRQLWRLVFSEGSTLLGKGLMALGLQNAAVIWTNRKPAELGNVTGINSVHTYAAHKAVHNMAMAQQQQQQQQHQLFLSSPSSSSPSSSSVSSSSFTVAMESSSSTTTGMVQGRTAVSLSSSQKSAGRDAASPLSRQMVTLSSRLSEPCGKEYDRKDVRTEDGVVMEVEREEGRRRGDESERDRGSSVGKSSEQGSHNSIGSKIHNWQKPELTLSSSLKASSLPLSSPSQLVSHEAATVLTSPPLTTPSVLGLNLATHHPQAALTAAMSTQLLAGLNLPALAAPGVATPLGNLAGLTSPVLFGGNPFLSLLASSQGLPKTVAMATNSMGGALHATSPAVAAALYKNSQSQQIGNVQQQASQLQFLSQLQERIQAHLRSLPSPATASSTLASPHVTQREQMNRLLSLGAGNANMTTASFPSSSPGAATAAPSTEFRLEFEQRSVRDLQLEEVVTTRTPPIHCIAAPPEILANSLQHISRTGPIPTEHVIEYIDTLELKRSLKSSRESRSECKSTTVHVHVTTDERVESNSGRNMSKESASSDSNDPQSKMPPSNLLPNRTSPRSHADIVKKESESQPKQSVADSRTVQSITHSPSSSSAKISMNTSTSLNSLERRSEASSLGHHSPSRTCSTPTHTLPTACTLMASSSAHSRVIATTAAISGIPESIPLLYAAPPSASAATPLLTKSLAASPSPLQGYYVVLNPLAGTAGVGSLGGSTGLHPLVVAAQASTAENGNNLSTSLGHNALTAAVGATAAIPLQLPGAGLANGGGVSLIPIPSLQNAATASLNSMPSPVLYYVPHDGSNHATVANGVSIASLPSTTVGAKKEESSVGKRNHIHNTLSPLSSTSSSSTSLAGQSGKAKKRPRRNSIEHHAPETKWIKLNGDESTHGGFNHVTGLEMKQVEGEKQCVDVGSSAKESYATTSDSEEEMSGVESILMQGGDNKASFSSYKGHLQLWEFLLDLLLTPNHGSIIQWTGNGYEFSIVNPEAVVRLWGAHKSKPHMTYEKMSRSLRYYYSQGIMDKVPGKRFTFKFAFDIQKYIIDNKKTSLFSLTS